MAQAVVEPSESAPLAKGAHRKNAASQHLFDFAIDHAAEDEQQLYKTLISNVRTASGVTLTTLADKMDMSISQISRLLGTKKTLSDQNRDKFFKVLEIDQARAKLCVVWFHDPAIYDEFTALAMTEALRELQNQFSTCRTDIHIDIKPSIIHELMKRAFDKLLHHQEQVLLRRDQLDI